MDWYLGPATSSKSTWTDYEWYLNQGGSMGRNLRGSGGVTYGGPLYPTIFNVVVDTVLQHWASLVEEKAGGQDRCGS